MGKDILNATVADRREAEIVSQQLKNKLTGDARLPLTAQQKMLALNPALQSVIQDKKLGYLTLNRIRDWHDRAEQQYNDDVRNKVPGSKPPPPMGPPSLPMSQEAVGKMRAIVQVKDLLVNLRADLQDPAVLEFVTSWPSEILGSARRKIAGITDTYFTTHTSWPFIRSNKVTQKMFDVMNAFTIIRNSTLRANAGLTQSATETANTQETLPLMGLAPNALFARLDGAEKDIDTKSLAWKELYRLEVQGQLQRIERGEALEEDPFPKGIPSVNDIPRNQLVPDALPTPSIPVNKFTYQDFFENPALNDQYVQWSNDPRVSGTEQQKRKRQIKSRLDELIRLRK